MSVTVSPHCTYSLTFVPEKVLQHRTGRVREPTASASSHSGLPVVGEWGGLNIASGAHGIFGDSWVVTLRLHASHAVL